MYCPIPPATEPEERARAAYALGWTIPRIAAYLGAPETRVRQWVRDLVRPLRELRMRARGAR